MRPTHLTIKGFRSFQENQPQTITFDALETAAIVGDTGSGKSSILEALTWALYGETSRGAKILQHVMNDQAERMEVALGFEADGRRLEVRRTARRTKKGQVVSDGTSLVEHGVTPVPELTADGRLVAEGVAPVAEQIRELVGMSCDAFLRTTILPQGRFGRLLAEDDQKVRGAVLRQIWPMADVDRAGDLVGQASAAAKELSVRAAQARAGHPEDLNAMEARLHDDAATARTAAGESHRRLDNYTTAADAAREAAGRARGHDQAVTRLTELERTWPDDELHRAEDRLAELETDRSAAETEVRRLEAAEPEADRAETAERAAARDTALAALGDITAETAQAVERRVEAMSRITGITRAIGRQSTVVEDANAKAENAERRQREAERDHQAKTETHRQLTEQHNGLSAATEKVAHLTRTGEQTRERTQAGRVDAERLSGRLADAARTLAQAERSHQDAEREVEHARTRAAASAAATGSLPGDPCPVCERNLPHGWTAPTNPDLDEAETRRDRAAETRTTAQRLEHQLRAEHAAAVKGVERDEGEYAEITRRLEPQRAVVLEQVDALGIPVADDPGENTLAAAQAAIETLTNRIAAKLAGCTEAGRALEDARRTATDAETARRVAEERVRTLQGDIEQASDAYDAAIERIEKLIARWSATLTTLRETESGSADQPPAEWPGPASEPGKVKTTEVDRTRDRLDGERKRMQAERAERDRKQAERLGAHQALQARIREAERHRIRIVEPTRARAATAESRLEQLLEGLPGGAGNVSAGRARDSADRAAEGLRLHAQAAESARADERIAGEAMALAAGGPEGTETEAADRLADEDDRAYRRAATTEYRLGEFRETRKVIETLDGKAHEIRRAHERLDELRRSLGPGQFPKYVTLRRSARLLAHASRHLRRMTGERYGFVDPRDTEERWRVVDHHTGREREPGQLSGGEQFLAALALALGAVETVNRIGGRIETLFIDEGFGALDQESLDRAIGGIGDAGGGRKHLIVLVSHVREVAAAAKDVILVEHRAGTGSSARQLTDTEREALIDPEGDPGEDNLLGAA